MMLKSTVFLWAKEQHYVEDKELTQTGAAFCYSDRPLKSFLGHTLQWDRLRIRSQRALFS